MPALLRLILSGLLYGNDEIEVDIADISIAEWVIIGENMQRLGVEAMEALSDLHPLFATLSHALVQGGPGHGAAVMIKWAKSPTM